MQKLFSLINSLNGMEKRYFKLAVTVHDGGGEKNYMKLFNAIAAQKVYDEDALKKELKGEKLLRRFDMSKNYLYKLVLNTLQSYHRESSIEQELHNLLNRSLVLYHKMLYKECNEVLLKARKIARKFDYHEILVQILQLMIRVAMAEKKDVRYTDPLHEEHRNVLEKVARVNEYRKLYHRLYTFFAKKGNDMRVAGLKRQYKEFLADPLISGKVKPQLYEEKNYFLLTSGLCHFCLGETQKSFDFTRKQLALITSNPQRIGEDPETYITALNSVIFYGSELVRIKEVEEGFLLLEEFLRTYPLQKHKIFIAYDNMMALYLTAGSFREGLPYADKVGEELPFFTDKLFESNLVSLYYDMFYIYFGCRKFEAALVWMNKLLNETTLFVREDIQVTARITNLILHYELKNYDLLPYLLRRTYRFLSKRKRLYRTEKIILKFVGRALKVSYYDQAAILEMFEEIKEELEFVMRRPEEARILTEYFEYTAWLESKIERSSFEKIVYEKKKAVRK
jgi:hypothetical protein